MRIVQLPEEQERLYFMCLEDWSDEIKEAGEHKAVWFDRMKNNGLRVRLALDDEGKVGGMIQYVPIEHSFAEGKGLYYVHCIWVHGHKQGRGNYQKRGMGKALLVAAEEDARELGARGIVAWGVILPFWMRASWFLKHGYSKADRQGLQVLLVDQTEEEAAGGEGTGDSDRVLEWVVPRPEHGPRKGEEGSLRIRRPCRISSDRYVRSADLPGMGDSRRPVHR
jgi:GNAT superfamily N-acetyltransferase